MIELIEDSAPALGNEPSRDLHHNRGSNGDIVMIYFREHKVWRAWSRGLISMCKCA